MTISVNYLCWSDRTYLFRVHIHIVTRLIANWKNIRYLLCIKLPRNNSENCIQKNLFEPNVALWCRNREPNEKIKDRDRETQDWDTETKYRNVEFKVERSTIKVERLKIEVKRPRITKQRLRIKVDRQSIEMQRLRIRVERLRTEVERPRI